MHDRTAAFDAQTSTAVRVVDMCIFRRYLFTLRKRQTCCGNNRQINKEKRAGVFIELNFDQIKTAIQPAAMQGDKSAVAILLPLKRLAFKERDKTLFNHCI